MKDQNKTRQHRLTEAFAGKTVVSVDGSCINVVHFTFSDGTKASVDAEEFHAGIPIVQLGEGWAQG